MENDSAKLSPAGSSALGTWIGLALFFVYVLVLALAAISEIFDLGWFNFPLFK